MNSSEAKRIFLQALPELSEPLKSAVEFTLAHWHNLNREPRASGVTINFFASLPALPSNDIDAAFAAKLNDMAKLLRDDSAVWLSLGDLPHEVARCCLTDDQVRYIRKNYKPYDKIFSAHSLAGKFNVSPPAIIDVVRFKTYKNVV